MMYNINIHFQGDFVLRIGADDVEHAIRKAEYIFGRTPSDEVMHRLRYAATECSETTDTRPSYTSLMPDSLKEK